MSVTGEWAWTVGPDDLTQVAIGIDEYVVYVVFHN